MLLFYIAATAFILTKVTSLPNHGQACYNTVTPPTSARGVNRLDRSSNLTLFHLQIFASSSPKDDNEDSVSYSVKIIARNVHIPFSEAKILISTKGPCDAGSLSFDTADFTDAKQNDATCPRLLLTNRKQPMVDTPLLTWQPPACGCVQFRTVIMSLDNVLYADKEDETNGPLSQTICVQQKATRELYLNAMCQVLEQHSVAEIISRPSFLQRHELETGRMDKHGLEMGLELRRSDNRLCCNKKSQDSKLACFDDSRRRRVDRFCEDGYPDIPFTSFRVSHMRDREKTCCFLLGEHRYTCFAEKSDGARAPAATLMDFSQDETDPVNDLAEFASPQDSQVVKSLAKGTFGEQEDNDDNSKEDNDGADKDDGKEKENKISHGRHISSRKPPHANEGIKTEKASSVLERHSHNMEKHGPTEITKINTTVPEFVNRYMTSAEKRQKAQRNAEHGQRASAESVSNRRASSREYTGDGRRTSSREYTGDGRRVSSREYTGDGRRVSSREYTADGRRVSSREYTGNGKRVSSREYTGDGRRASRERVRVTSSERRSKARTSAQKRQDWSEYVDEHDFDDQGGKSVDLTLNKLQKQMDRLRLRRQCCEAGALAGRPVYGWYPPVRRECEHSGQKYIRVVDIPSWVRPCLDQFIKCCVEQAVSGPVVTSSEFRDKQYLYVNNLKKLGPVGAVPELERQEDWDQPEGGHPEGNSRDVPERETPEAYEVESERRFQSMREVTEVPKDANDDEDIDGPKRFDEADNGMDGDFDILDRKAEIVNNTMDDVEADEESDDDDDDERVLVNKKVPDTIGDLKQNKTLEQQKDNSSDSKTEHNKKTKVKDQLDRVSDLVETAQSKNDDSISQKRESLLAKTPGGRSREVKNSQGGGRSRGGKTNSRESRQQVSEKDSRSSTSEERRRHFARTYYNNNGGHGMLSYGKVGTQDSQEMAAAHVRKFMGTLDSKEMLDVYKRTNPEKQEFLSDGTNDRARRGRKYNRQRTYY